MFAICTLLLFFNLLCVHLLMFVIIVFLQGAGSKRFLDVLASSSFTQFLAPNIMFFNRRIFIGFA
jgi:hypothetical protein